MKHLLLVAAVLGSLALIPSSAQAWTHCGTPQAESDCPPVTVCVNGETRQVPDTGTLPPGATEGECVPPPPEQPPVVPPEQPPVEVVPPPAPPVENTPPVDTPDVVPEDTPKGEGHVEYPVHEVAGKEQQDTPPAPAETVEADTTSLPYTGTSVVGPAALGLALLAMGAGLLFAQRRVRR